VDSHLLLRRPMVTDPPTDVALAPLIVAMVTTGVVSTLHMADSHVVALIMPPMHPGHNAWFA
jgi:hypothetical protein